MSEQTDDLKCPVCGHYKFQETVAVDFNGKSPDELQIVFVFCESCFALIQKELN